MALIDKNIVITPNIGSASDPKIVFSGANASTTAQNITLTAYPTNSGTLSFDGSAGQLFSITNSLSGSIFSVNDVSGIPSIEVLDTGIIKLAQYSGNILLGTATDNGTDKLQVTGSITATKITSTVATGTAPFVVTSTTAVANLSIGGNAATVTNGVYTTTAQTLTNKSLSDSTTYFIDETDATKKLQFQLSSITTATTRTLSVPDVNGTIITTGDTGTVTSTMIAEGTIVNGDISASAAIAITKLASSTISGISLGSNLNALTISSPLVGTSYNGSTAVTLSIPAATTSVSGYLTSTDWNTFNGKQPAGSYLTASTGVTTFGGGTTGLTPSTATSGAVTLAGTLAVANGGTGRTTTNPKLIGSFAIAAGDTNWWRVAAMDGSNQPRYAKFLIVTGNHLNIEITFSNGAGGDYGHVEVVVRGHFAYWTAYPSFIRYNPTGTNLPSYVEIQLPLTGGTGNTFTVYELENFSLSNAWVTYPMATTGVATDAGTKLQFFSNTAILRRDGYIGNGYTKEITIPTGTTGQSLISNGSAVPSWITLTLMNIPGDWSKKACDAATTVALTLNTAQVTIDGITLSATSRVLVKNQAAPAQNGIYTGVTTTLWVRDIDADTSGEIAGATVSVDAGTVNFGQLWTNNFQPTDTLGTTAMNWYRLLDTSMTGVGFNSLMGYGTTVSSATALVLTKASGYLQYVTGSTAQVITLPDVTTLTLGWSYQITNNNTANNITINSSGANLVYTLIPGITVMITCILITGTTAASWNYEDGGAIITNDIATSTNIYPLCAAATSGSAVTVYTSNTKYLYKPSTGELSSPEVIATNGLVLNSSTISSSYIVAAGTNAMSVGPITVNSGAVVTVSAGQKWVIL